MPRFASTSFRPITPAVTFARPKFNRCFYMYKNITSRCVCDCGMNSPLWLATISHVTGSRIYSRSAADPASEVDLLPPTGMLVSTAIISARISRTGCWMSA